MRCVLHIGTEKTGTTFLQEWLYSNRAVFSKRGIFLSEKFGGKNNFYISEYFQSYIDKWAFEANLRTMDDKNRYFAGFDRAAAAEFKAAALEHDVFIITSEFLHSRMKIRSDLAKLREFLMTHFSDVRVICYFREQCAMATSLYSTDVLRDCEKTLDDYLNDGVNPDNYYFNFEAIADNWSVVFGRENCDFRIYDRDLFADNDIRKDFLEAIDSSIPHKGIDFSQTSANQSLTALQAVAIMNLNRRVPFFKGATTEWNPENLARMQNLLQIGQLRRGRLGSRNAAEISARFTLANKRFFDKYFDGRDMFAVPASLDMAAGGSGAGQDDDVALSYAAALTEELIKALLPPRN